MRRTPILQVLTLGAVIASFAGCTHVPVNIKAASARQAELLANFERSLESQDVGKGCTESFKAALEMEQAVKQHGQAAQETINKNFADSRVRAQAFKEKAPEKATQKEAFAIQTMIEQTTKLQGDIARLQAEVEIERGKCAEALASVRDTVHSLAGAQAELDKFIQSDAKSPAEAFLFNFVETKTFAKKMDASAKILQSRMGTGADKFKQWESMIEVVKE